MSELKKGTVMSENTKYKISQKLKGRVITQEHKDKIALGRLGKKHSTETKLQISKRMSGINHPNYGKKANKETIQKRANSLSKYTYMVTFPDGHIEYIKNLHKFSIENNLSHSTMYAVVNGKRTHHKGFKCKRL